MFSIILNCLSLGFGLINKQHFIFDSMQMCVCVEAYEFKKLRFLIKTHHLCVCKAPVMDKVSLVHGAPVLHSLNTLTKW